MFTTRFSPIKALIFVAALAVLVWAGNLWRTRLAELSAPTGRLAGLDRWLVGTYLDLIRSQDVDKPISNDPTPVRFIVDPLETAASIGQKLEAQGLVADGELFRSYVRFSGDGDKIQAGTFMLRRNMSIREIALALQRAQTAEITVTIPEGKRIEEIAELLEQQAGVSAGEFLRLARLQEPNFAPEYPFLADLPSSATLEGYLFPDTYRLPQNPTAQDVVLRMLDNFGAKAAPLLEQARAAGRQPREALIVASIVEREAVVADERPMIASVYLNRLSIGQKLDADPTTQYALGYDPAQNKWWRELTLEDYKYADPTGYNTYINPALPPGPIASPGLGSIQAAVSPAQSDYKYFLACPGGDGTHQFSVTYEEHLTKYGACP
jgi:UPF0755 protein